MAQSATGFQDRRRRPLGYLGICFLEKASKNQYHIEDFEMHIRVQKNSSERTTGHNLLDAKVFFEYIKDIDAKNIQNLMLWTTRTIQ